MMEQASATKTRLDALIKKLAAEVGAAPRDALQEFTRGLLARGSGDFLERSLETGVREVAALYRLLDETPPGEFAARLRPDPDDPDRAVLHTVMDDCPFIVDTLREYVHSLDVGIPYLLHPVLVVERDEAGRVAEVKDRSAAGSRTSVVHITMEGELDLDDEKRASIEREVLRRLRAVQAVTTDFPEMLERVSEITRQLDEKKRDIPWRAAELEEVQELLRWLAEIGFVFLGYRAYDITSDESGRNWISVDSGSGLGILRDAGESRYAEPRPVDELPPDFRARVLGGPLLIVSKTNAESPVRRRARMDYVGIKRLADDGTIRGEHRLLGLFTAKAYNQEASTIPILRRKLREILEQEGAPKGSHDYNLIFQTFNSMPKEELFLASVDELRAVIDTVRETEGADDVRVTARRDVLGRGLNVLVILPKHRFSAEVRRKLQKQLVGAYHGRLLNYHLALGQGDQARLHFYISASPEDAEKVDLANLETLVRETIRTWEERLEDALDERFGSRLGHELAERHRGDFSAEYQASVDIRSAVADVQRLEDLDETGLQQVALDPVDPARPTAFSLKIFAPRGMFVLSDIMPTLENAGFRVIEAYRHAVGGSGEFPAATIHVFQVEVPPAWRLDARDAEPRLADTLRAILAGEAEDDRLNALVLSAGLTWPQVAILRAYAGYLFRIGAGSRLGAHRTLIEHPLTARLLLDAFEARMNPAIGGARGEALADVRREFLDSLEAVPGIEEDRTFRRLLQLIESTLRTNHYRGPHRHSPLLALKFDCRAIEFMPQPRPRFEVYLRGPHTEAAHLRMGEVARGGIRWSDRNEDFRVEVLGLVKTQRVKNAVIVPAGAKGAFISKPRLAAGESPAEAGVRSYKEFIRGLLEVTDNVVEGEVRHPEGVVAHDGPDPYLVVAADKGTAKLSDTANALARGANFWLDDAFASGGSQGYDHKKEGITARGAWECVKRHFRELGHDIASEPFTVAGVGDMSGDVFGNGMLLSDQIRLVAAFDHRHIFVDPDPDPAASWAERKRLFDLPASTWEDYDPAVLSDGGGVYARTEKEIRLSPQARERIGVEAEAVNGDDLIRAILGAPVDLLWNGGIGTYVKAGPETHADVGDPSNDRVRIDASALRARAVGEGGNLGMTQQARVEYALAGGRLNTDALDNSAGVDMSDHEVNLKILLGAAVARGSLTEEARNDLLRECTDQVAASVLANNYSQSLAISLDAYRARTAPGDFLEALQRLEREGILDPVLESLPGVDELQEREAAGQGLTRPELAVLLAHAKLHLKQWLLESSVPDDPAMLDLVLEYFPPIALEAVEPGDVEAHRLRSHIATTVLTNRFVDRMGAASHIQLMSETGRSAVSVARTWFVAQSIADADPLYARLERLDAEVRAEVQYQWFMDIADALRRATAWLLRHMTPTGEIGEAIESLQGPIRELRAALPELLTDERLEAFRARCAQATRDGLDERAALELSTFRHIDELLPIARLVRDTSAASRDVGAVYLGLADDIDFPWLRQRLDLLGTRDVWAQRAARSLIVRLERARSRLTQRILDQPDGAEVARSLGGFRRRFPVELNRIRNMVVDVQALPEIDLAALLVAVEAIDESDLVNADWTEGDGRDR